MKEFRVLSEVLPLLALLSNWSKLCIQHELSELGHNFHLGPSCRNQVCDRLDCSCHMFSWQEKHTSH